MPTHKKNTLLKNAQANAESIFFKRVFFSPPPKPPFLFLQIYFSQRTDFVRNRTDIASNVNSFGQSVCKLDTPHLRTGRRATHNMNCAQNQINLKVFVNSNLVDIQFHFLLLQILV